VAGTTKPPVSLTDSSAQTSTPDSTTSSVIPLQTGATLYPTILPNVGQYFIILF